MTLPLYGQQHDMRFIPVFEQVQLQEVAAPVPCVLVPAICPDYVCSPYFKINSRMLHELGVLLTLRCQAVVMCLVAMLFWALGPVALLFLRGASLGAGGAQLFDKELERRKRGSQLCR